MLECAIKRRAFLSDSNKGLVNHSLNPWLEFRGSIWAVFWDDMVKNFKFGSSIAGKRPFGSGIGTKENISIPTSYLERPYWANSNYQFIKSGGKQTMESYLRRDHEEAVGRSLPH